MDDSNNIFANISAKPLMTNPHRLNDFDANILEEKAYLDVQDHILKLECRINFIEKEISQLNGEIRSAEKLLRFNEVNILKIKKQKLQFELADLNKEYGDIDISTRISNGIVSVFKSDPKKNKIAEFISENILSKISKRFSSGQNLKSALEKLSAINKNVDELITMQTPYGETKDRYDKLTEYLNRANVIHYQITQSMNV